MIPGGRLTPFMRRHMQTLDLGERLQLARQFTPSLSELKTAPGFGPDPLDEEDGSIHPHPSILHKYPQKVLLLSTGRCPVLCRFCTRKRETAARYLRENISEHEIGALLDYIATRPRVNEVIFSGGDPFMLPDRLLFSAAQKILAQQSILTIRYHTRTVTVLPGRFNRAFLAGLQRLAENFPDKEHKIVLHINTAAEISPQSRLVIDRLQQLGYVLYSQSVLLRRINDSRAELQKLFVAIAETGIRPYYLHQLDKIEGAAHFETDPQKGLELHRWLADFLQSRNISVPQYVRDSKNGKTPVIPAMALLQS